ncbi:hypothetical protein HQ585_15330 [candidate division KSB1 bacterium]|nr:hypothetical protein [candidate division KSB1 bacterium]
MNRIILILIIICINSVYAQENNWSLFFAGGKASDDFNICLDVGGNCRTTTWESGPIFRLGTEYKLNNTFDAQGFVSYSFYKYDHYRYGDKKSDGYN